LLRLAEAEGGFGIVVAKGDPQAGAICVILTERGANPRLFERLLQGDHYCWAESRGSADSPEKLSKLLESRRRFDPDSWIIELDIASAERFAAEMNSVG
jgi:hypothetical protein